jgi:adenosylhomocysteine nucleosidase
MISASAEWKAVADRYPGATHTPYGDFVTGTLGGERVIFFHGGYGKVNAAGSTQYAIDRWHPQLVINLGTCGAFGHDLHVGDVVLAKTTTIYDIYEAMGDADESIADFRTQLDTSKWPAQLASRVRVEPLVSADRDLIPGEIAKLRAKYDAGAGDWESGAIAYVATKNHTRVVILRGVTDVLDETQSPTTGNLALWQAQTAKVMTTLFALAGDALPSLLRP